MARSGGELRAALILWLAVTCAGPAAAQVRAVDLYAPRPFGYSIGDIVAHRVEIALDEAYRLDPASLPQPHALNYWLELENVRVADHGSDGGARRYTLDLVYQTFYAPLEPKRLDIPALTLSAVNGERRATVTVPAWSFLMSPLREIVATGPGQTMALRPDIAPWLIPTARALHALIATAAVAALALTALVWQMGWWPFNCRPSRPFARAARLVRAALARSPTSAASASAYRAALLALHRGFDATAGKGVFAEDLPAFFQMHPAFRTLEVEVKRLFNASRSAFFGSDPAGAANELPAEDLITLSRRLRAIERIAS
jgi:mxaA protein